VSVAGAVVVFNETVVSQPLPLK
jgi:hypothetical protein